MSAAKCICMGPGSAPPLSMGMTSRQFTQPPCPCIKCKERAREQHEARVQAIAQSNLGICGQTAKTPCGPGMGAAKGMGMGPVGNSGKCGRPEMGPRMGPRMGPGMGPSMGPRMGPGMGPGMGVGKAPGMGSCKGICMVPSSKPGTRTGPDMGPIVGACNRPGRGMGPGMGPAMGPDGHTNSDMEAINRSPTKQGCSPQKVTKNDVQSNDPKCQCMGAQLDAEREASSQDSTESPTGLIFGGAVTQRKSSITQGGYRQIIFPHSGCAAKDYDELDDDDNMLMANVDLGRDTFGLPVILQGNAGILNTGGFCRDTMLCDEFCGIGRGCSAGCNKGSTAGATATAAGQKTAGIRICSNEYINTILTFLMEVLGILVFFAVCTITFWITLGYYIVQLLIELKNANRNVHVAVGTVLSLLILAFAVTLVTHSEGTCRHRAIAIRKGIESSGSTSTSSCSKCNKAVTAAAKRACAHKCKTSAKPKLKTTTSKPSSGKSCAAKLGMTSNSKPKAKPQKPKRVYSDCQGRAIFDRSRRNSILIEMKQPPTWLIWLRDSAHEFFHRQ